MKNIVEYRLHIRILLIIIIGTILSGQCPELIHIDYTDNFRIRRLNWEKAVYDSVEINQKIDFLFSNLNDNNNRVKCMDDFVYPKFCDRIDEFQIQSENFEFLTLIPINKNDEDSGIIFAKPKCSIRDKIPYFLEFNYSNAEHYHSYDTLDYYHVSLRPRRFFKNDKDNIELPSKQLPLPNLNDSCSSLLVFEVLKSDFFKDYELVRDSVLFNQTIDKIFSQKYDIVRLKCFEQIVYPTVCDIPDSVMLNPSNFDIEKLRFVKHEHVNDNHVMGDILLKPKCSIRHLIPYKMQMTFAYEKITEPNLDSFLYIQYYSHLKKMEN